MADFLDTVSNQFQQVLSLNYKQIALGPGLKLLVCITVKLSVHKHEVNLTFTVCRAPTCREMTQ